jgi:predicted RNA-binding protein YlxR (DUF448 family)
LDVLLSTGNCWCWEREGVVIRKRKEEGRSVYLVLDRNLLRQREKAEKGA